MPADDARRDDARHQAVRRRAGASARPRRDRRRLGRRRARLVRRARRPARRGLDAATTLLAWRPPSPPGRSTPTASTEYLVKSAREAEEHTSWTDAGRCLRGGARATRRGARGRTRRSRRRRARSRDVVDRHAAPGLGAVARLAGRPADRSRRARPVPGHRSVHVLAGRPGQPGRARLGRSPCTRRTHAGALDGPAAWSGDDIEAAKAVVITRTLGAAPPPGGGVRPGRPIPGARHHRRARRCGARLRSGRGRRASVVTIVATRGIADWGDTAVELPAGSWRNVLDDDASPAVQW